MTITEFLTARYDEYEAAARRDPLAKGLFRGGNGYSWSDSSYELADIAAKRAIVVLHPVYEYRQKASPWRKARTFLHCDTCGDPHGLDRTEPVDWPCPTLRALAQPYAEHPDFDPSWRVSQVV